jgi:hypothetical protein
MVRELAQLPIVRRRKRGEIESRGESVAKDQETD